VCYTVFVLCVHRTVFNGVCVCVWTEQIGDVFAVLIEFYFSMGNMEKCYQVSLPLVPFVCCLRARALREQAHCAYT
jgi:hypothetical protein